MTSTIAPAEGTFLLVRKAPVERLRDYVCALHFYATELVRGTFDKIVYVDNSGYDLTSLIAVAEYHAITDRVEFISYVSTVSPDVSRFYLELNLLREAMLRSQVLQNIGNQRIWKITGRYIVHNVRQICQRAIPGADIVANFRNHPKRVVDFYLIAFNRAAFEETLLSQIESFNCRTDGEIIYRTILDSSPGEAFTIERRLPATPRISGVRGFDGAIYSGYKIRLKFALRFVANRLTPKIWI